MSDSLGHVLRQTNARRRTESMNRFFGQHHNDGPDAETSITLDAGARSSPPPQPIDGNAILREVFEDAVGAKQMRRRWG